MIPIGEKDAVRRQATATGTIRLKAGTVRAILGKEIKKGDTFEASKIAAMLAVKDTPRILPHCHQLPIEGCDVRFSTTEDTLTVECTVSTTAKTGVEMEALIGASVALLTVWDMVKYLEKDREGQYPGTAIGDIRVIEKLKGGTPWTNRTKSTRRTRREA